MTKKKDVQFSFRPECGYDDRIGPDIGPFAGYLQIIYRELTCDPKGAMDNCLAVWNDADGHWYLNRNNPVVKRCTKAGDGKLPWSDLAIFVSS